MSDSNEKLGERHNQGKPRFDLLPWGEFAVYEDRVSVEVMYDALRKWWVGAPFSMTMLNVIPRAELVGVAAVLAFGAQKYAPRNWEIGLPYSSCFASACRHAEAYARGEHTDPETGLAHASHFWCNVLFLVVFARRGRTSLDDRPAPLPEVAAALAQAEASVRARTPGSKAGQWDSLLANSWGATKHGKGGASS